MRDYTCRDSLQPPQCNQCLTTLLTAHIGWSTQTPQYWRAPHGLLTTGLAHTTVSRGTCWRTECAQTERGSPSYVMSGNDILPTFRATIIHVFIIVITAASPSFYQPSYFSPRSCGSGHWSSELRDLEPIRSHSGTLSPSQNASLPPRGYMRLVMRKHHLQSRFFF